jgi:hypothetical protein
MGEMIFIGVILITCIEIGIIVLQWRILGEATGGIRGTRRPYTGWLFLIIGCLVLLLAGVDWVRTSNFTHNAVRTSGTIIGMQLRADESNGSVSYAPTFSFQDTAGHQNTVSSVFYSSRKFHTGDVVAVLYLRDNPETARIDSFWQMWGLSSCAGVFGSICLTIGVVVVFWPRTFGRLTAEHIPASV